VAADHGGGVGGLRACLAVLAEQALEGDPVAGVVPLEGSGRRRYGMVGGTMTVPGAQESGLGPESNGDPTEIAARKRVTEERFGQWTAHNIALGNGLFTIGPDRAGDRLKIERVMQLVQASVGRSWSDLRVLDLACLEGGYALEAGRRGAKVVGVEIREEHVARAEFARDALGLENVEFVVDDVRNVSSDKYGTFDVVFCLGILYHLPRRDVFAFLQKLGELTERALIVNTHVSLFPWQRTRHAGMTYWGKTFLEHPPTASAEARKRAVWSSIDNTTSFWLTRPSLVRLLEASGFGVVMESWSPYDGAPPNRVSVLALKESRYEALTAGGPVGGGRAGVPEKRSWAARVWMWVQSLFG